MAEFNWDAMLRSVRDREFARYVLRARERLLRGQAAMLQQIRAVYDESAELLADDVRRLSSGPVMAGIRQQIREAIRRRIAELIGRVSRAVISGIHLGARAGVDPFAQITAGLTTGIVDSLRVEQAFLVLAERQAAAQIARVGRDGLRLSDRIWTLDSRTRRELERLVQSATLAGWSPRELAAAVERFLKPGVARPHKLALQRALGIGAGTSYQAMRLARTELAIASHEASIAAAAATPGVEWVDWLLSPSHRIRDICDVRAANSPYPINAVPPLGHPNCRCRIVPRLPDREAAVDRLVRWVRDPASDPALGRWWSNLRPLLGAGPRPVIRLTTASGTTATAPPVRGNRLADVAPNLTTEEGWRSLTLAVDSLMRDAAAAEGVGYHVTGWTADGPVAGPTMDHAFGFTHLRPGGGWVVIAGEVASNVVAMLWGDAPPGPARAAALRGLRALLHEASHQLRNYGGVTTADLGVLKRWGAGLVVEEGTTELLAVLRLPDFAARIGVELPARVWAYASPAYRPFARFVAGLASLAGKTRGAELVAWVHEWRTGPPAGWLEAIARSILAAHDPEAGVDVVRWVAGRIERAADGIRKAWERSPAEAETVVREELRALAAWMRARSRRRPRRLAGVAS